MTPGFDPFDPANGPPNARPDPDPDPDAALPAYAAGERGGLVGLHRDRRAQILPLVFFMGIAFFTSVVLVLNTGRTTVRRIRAQNAVDAAVVSGANAVARGMNYVASNNISISKLLATVVILRAFGPAIDDANATLDVWQAIGEALEDMAGVPYVGPALAAAGAAILVKVEIERAILEVLEPIVDALKDAWDGDNESGVAWILIRALHYLGVGTVYATPVLAQWTTVSVYNKNVAPESGAAWMLPLYPNLPACEGKFADFYDWTKHWVEAMADPIYIAGWALLTLSMFPLWYKAHLTSELNQLFTGSGTDTNVDDPDTKKMQELNKQLDEKNAELTKLENQRVKLQGELDDLKKRKADGEKGLDDDIQKKQQEVNAKEVEIEKKRDEIKDIQDQIQEINDRRTQQGGKPPDDFNGDLGGMQGSAQDRDWPHPWLLDGSKYPDSFSYVGIGWRSLGTPLVPVKFQNLISQGFTYAAARVYNSTQADLWTADWRARLVKVDVNMLSNPIGTLPHKCGEQGGSGGSEISQNGPDGQPDANGLADQLNTFLGFLNKH